MESRFQECLLGVQVGDALGMPVEIMTPKEILAATEGKGVTGFIDPVQRRIHDTMDLKAGDTTDDWQLTQVVAESLVACGDYDQADQAQRHIVALRESTFGWGGTTTQGIQSLIDGRDPNEFPSSPGPGRGCGNGVAMKIAPIALFMTGRYGHHAKLPLREVVMRHGKLTHPDLRASICAHALAYGIWHVLIHPMRGRCARETFMADVILAAADAEEALGEGKWNLRGSVSSILDRAFGSIHAPKLLRNAVGTGCVATESVPFALATFARHYDSFKSGLLEAVNAGGDTDTIAAMVGALLGANSNGNAASRAPESWINGLRDKGAAAKRLGSALYRAAVA